MVLGVLMEIAPALSQEPKQTAGADVRSLHFVFLDCLNAVHLRHLRVHGNNAGVRLSGLSDRPQAIHRLADDLQVLFPP